MRLTKRQREILDFVSEYIQFNGYAPTLEEIAGHFGLSSLATVHKHLKNLEQKGAILRDWNRGRAMEVQGAEPAPVEAPGGARSVELPLLGEVAAGLPIDVEVDRESVWVPEDMLGARSMYALRARGSSMIEEQIRDGDLLLVEESPVASRGETVIALVEGSAATVKKFYPEGERVRLQPANQTMEPIYVSARDLQIQGIVRGVIRRY